MLVDDDDDAMPPKLKVALVMVGVVLLFSFLKKPFQWGSHLWTVGKTIMNGVNISYEIIRYAGE